MTPWHPQCDFPNRFYILGAPAPTWAVREGQTDMGFRRPSSQTATCPWCDGSFTSRIVGVHRKKFCSVACKDAYHSALRKWAKFALERGDLSISDLKAASPSCTTDG